MAPNKVRIGGVTKQTFMEADTHTKDGLLFDMLAEIKDSTCQKIEEVRGALIDCQQNREKVVKGFDDRLKTVEEARKKDRKKDTAIAGGGGVVGGFIAMVAKWLWS